MATWSEDLRGEFIVILSPPRSDTNNFVAQSTNTKNICTRDYRSRVA
jgi:hypothetical protein